MNLVELPALGPGIYSNCRSKISFVATRLRVLETNTDSTSLYAWNIRKYDRSIVSSNILKIVCTVVEI
jgi:hypothetical protein